MANKFQGFEWQFYIPSLFSRVPSLFEREPVVMARRSPNGSWNYRLPNEQERLEWFELRQY